MRPTIGRLSPPITASEANVWRRSWIRTSSQFRSLADPPPWLLKVRQVRIVFGSDDHIRVSFDTLGIGQDLERRPVERYRLRPCFGIGQVNPVAPDMLPLQRLNLGQPRAGVEQKPKRVTAVVKRGKLTPYWGDRRQN